MSNFDVIYRARVGHELWQVPALALGGLAVCLVAGGLAYSLSPLGRPARGSLILAGAFGNVTYLGLPVLRGLFPAALHLVTTTAILYEMTITPTNLVAGSALAAAFAAGGRFSLPTALGQVARLPLLWAIAIALALNVGGVQVPAFVLSATSLLGEAVSAIMMLSLGMALRVEALAPAVLLCTVIGFATIPLVHGLSLAHGPS